MQLILFLDDRGYYFLLIKTNIVGDLFAFFVCTFLLLFLMTIVCFIMSVIFYCMKKEELYNVFYKITIIAGALFISFIIGAVIL